MDIRTLVLWYQVSLDTGAAICTLYMGMAISQEFGRGSRKEKWQLATRVACGLVSIAWGYHATDLLMRPGEHGLTFSNVFLHTACLGFFSILSARLWRFAHGENGNGIRKGADGRILTGMAARRDLR